MALEHATTSVLTIYFLYIKYGAYKPVFIPHTECALCDMSIVLIHSDFCSWS